MGQEIQGVRMYRADLGWKGGGMLVLQAVVFSLFLTATVFLCFTISDKRFFVVPAVFAVACGVWGYGLLSIPIRGCRVSVADGKLEWVCRGLVITKKTVVPLEDIRGLEWNRPAANFRQVLIFTSQKTRVVYAILSEAHCAEIHNLIVEAAS